MPSCLKVFLSFLIKNLACSEISAVIIYDPISKSYREAAFDISEGQPIPTQKPFQFQIVLNMEGYKPSSLETIFFNRYSGEAANFLEKALELFDAPIVKIGRHVGDTNNRYFAMEKYSK